MTFGPIDRRDALKLLGGAAGLVGIGTTGSAIAQSGDDTTSGQDSGSDSRPNSDSDVASVTFDSQTVPARSETVEVVVAESYLPEGGWIVIHNERLLTEDDPVGSIIGVSEYLKPGRTEYVEIEVEAAGIIDADEDGDQTLVAMPHTEDDDSEDDPVFEFPNEDDDETADDTPYVDSEDTNGDGVEVVIDKAQITFEYEDEDEDDEEYEDEDYSGNTDDQDEDDEDYEEEDDEDYEGYEEDEEENDEDDESS